MLKHNAGDFPRWLAPNQVRIITLNDDAARNDNAKPIVNEPRANVVRVEPEFEGLLHPFAPAEEKALAVVATEDLDALYEVLAERNIEVEESLE